jgi:hypothetical protein
MGQRDVSGRVGRAGHHGLLERRTESSSGSCRRRIRLSSPAGRHSSVGTVEHCRRRYCLVGSTRRA